MALVPSRQFYPTTTTFIDSFQSSVSRVHVTTRLQFLRYGSSIPFKKQNLSPVHDSINSDSTPQKNPQSKFNFVRKNKNNRWGFASETSISQSIPSVTRKTILAAAAAAAGSTMERIVEKLKKFGYIDDVNEKKEKLADRVIEKGSIEDIFYVEEGMLPNSRGGFSEESPLGVEGVFGSGGEVRFPWEKSVVKEEEKRLSVRQNTRKSMAELTLPESELRRLRNLTIRTKNKTRIGGAGVTQAVVDLIHEKWKSSEIVRLKIEGAPALNMKRMHEILERKTGGLVIWRSGTSVSLYRATDKTSRDPSESPCNDVHTPQTDSESTVEEGKNTESLPEVKYEDEVDKLLDGLGPRYTDWPGCDPLPVDADLLPGVVPGYQPPFRILPYGVRSTLGVKEATSLRRIARVLPPHFALGRSRQHQGLVVAMIKLWERSSIAKIALKRGVQLTTSERMAEDIKKLTGGVLLSRNKDFLVFYRGKDFLSPDVAEALLEKERLAKTLQDGEERARKLERKLAFAERKVMKAERALSKVEEFLNPADRPADPESITDEERFMFRKLGLRMKAFLLLGRRGVFDGTVENMHLHWKYRELVKIMVKAKSFDQVKNIALSLEAESGGVLVSVDKVSKGYAIIVFRGKDYKRPSALRPKNLLTKRKALARSIELQRHEALLNHISTLQMKVEKLRSEIEQMAIVKGHGDDKLYDKLDSAYPTEDDSEEEGDEAYLETYDSDNIGENESDNSIHNLQLETNFPYDFQDQESETELTGHYPYAIANASHTRVDEMREEDTGLHGSS
ncbi:hypothetical protein F0562_000436 [Nyssa sinensis]|uniref:CRM domain-containing protein n=1 Tax=Nyssa sinensis TaxID=561372 RepID=A0A5J5C4C0_9ASTE|nr:hypothetical protein F0562_000436 [Nyssa sinensis]